MDWMHGIEISDWQRFIALRKAFSLTHKDITPCSGDMLIDLYIPHDDSEAPSWGIRACIDDSITDFRVYGKTFHEALRKAEEGIYEWIAEHQE